VNFYSRTFALGAGVNAKTSNKTIENFSGGGPDRITEVTPRQGLARTNNLKRTH
jgi:hypothetical protein